MTMTYPSSGERNFECIDPGLGSQIWRLDDPTTDQDMLEALRLHVRHCADCRLSRDLQHHVASGLHDGRLSLGEIASPAPAWAAWLTGGGITALAACLALVFLLAPRLPNHDVILRGADAPLITSPTANTVIRDRTPELHWTPLERATRYEVTIREVGGDYAWRGESATPDLIMPDDADLPTSARFRMDVTPFPSYLAPEGLQTSFRTGSWTEFLSFRLGAAPRGVQAGALLGLLALLGGGLASAMLRR